MFKFIKKLKENIEFYRWAYANKDIKNKPVSCYISVNNVKPILVCVEKYVSAEELNQYERFIKQDMLMEFSEGLNKHLVLEKEDMMNGTIKVKLQCYISPFVEVQNNGCGWVD